MNKAYLFSTVLCFTFMISGHSSNPDTADSVVTPPTIIPVSPTYTLTTLNVKTYMMDATATAETVAVLVTMLPKMYVLPK